MVHLIISTHGANVGLYEGICRDEYKLLHGRDCGGLMDSYPNNGESIGT